MQPSVDDGLFCRFFILKVTEHHRLAPHDDFTDPVFILIDDADIRAYDRLTGQVDNRSRDSLLGKCDAAPDKKQKKDKKAKKEQKMKDKEAEKAAMDEQTKDMEAYEAELKEILTDDQYKTWEELKNNRPQGPGGRPGGFGPGGRPGGFGPGGPGGRPGGFGGPGGTTYPSREQ